LDASLASPITPNPRLATLAKSVDGFSITGPMAQKKYSSVLGWDSPFDGVCKLEREKERMENANTLGEFVEYPMNLALTAYHRLASVHPIGHQCDADPAIDALYISDSDQR
jgi:hypothetical protein